MRAAIRAGSLTLVHAELANVRGGPMGCLARAALDERVAIADLEFGAEEAEEIDGETTEGESENAATADGDCAERDVEIRFLANESPAARRTLRRWAARVGHRRIWFRDEVIDLEPPAELDGEFVTTCPSCGLEIRDSGPELTKFVRSVGYFPPSCFVCGSFVPQWEPVQREAGRLARRRLERVGRLRVVESESRL